MEELKGLTLAEAMAETDLVNWREMNAYSLGLQAYMFGFPLIYMAELRHLWVTNPEASFYAALNHLHVKTELATATNYTTGGSPNNDTLYAWGWIDLTKEPVIFSVPETNGRYYVIELADFYSDNFAYIGKRTTGTNAGNYAITPPGWKGDLPADINGSFESPTPYALAFERTAVNGEADVEAVNAIQSQFKITPLSYWGKPDAKLPENHEIWGPYEAVNDLMGDWKTINRAMTENPPRDIDQTLVTMMKQIGIGPGESLDFDHLHPSILKGLKRAAIDGKKMLRPAILEGGGLSKFSNSWMIPAKIMGRAGYSNEYVFRAAIQNFGGIICNDPAEAVYMTAMAGEDKKHLNGVKNYRIHFDNKTIPPVNEFWSLSMYGIDHNFVDNPINKYAIGDRTPNIKKNEDGSFDIYIQHESPGAEREDNWLPCPEKEFYMILRAYGPDESIIEQTWIPPVIEVVK
ncbi:DUF1254 domain-containing protein [Listeria welshimeri]|uniref:DUF1254 domain-containing protein n=1 Tax=Listeria welshimeri TaxID=1643 RepID=UPI0018897222|nr:DUF1254 domain-containing protein [Listeria welshimeri]MBF2573828.1 DUF1254 domain-containing protein [Listeria welshimeri]